MSCVYLSDIFLITRIWLYVCQRIPWSQGDLFITLCHKVPDVHLANVVLTRISYSVLWTLVTKQRPHLREEANQEPYSKRENTIINYGKFS